MKINRLLGSIAAVLPFPTVYYGQAPSSSLRLHQLVNLPYDLLQGGLVDEKAGLVMGQKDRVDRRLGSRLWCGLLQ